MDVAVIYSKDIFSENTETIIRGYLAKMNPAEMEGLEIHVQFYELREIDHQTVAVTIRKACVKIVIISHHFLEHLDSAVRQQNFSILNRILNKSAVIAVLVRVTDSEIRQNYGDLLPHYENWNALELRTLRGVDPHFFKTFTDQIIRSYNMQRSSTQPKLPFRDPALSPPIVNFSQESPLDSALSCSQNNTGTGILLIKSEVIWDECLLKVTLDQQVNVGDIISIRLKKTGNNGENDDAKIFLVSFEIPGGKACNSFRLEIAAPTSTNVRRGSTFKSTQALESTIQRLPAYRKCLDEHVSEILSKHFKDGTPHELDTRLDMILEVQQEKSSLFPTLMHLAVYYGLESSVWTLLEEGSGIEMCEIQNCNSDTPLNIAEKMGFSLTIGKTIQDYKEVMVTWDALQYMRVLYETYGLRKPSTAGIHRSLQLRPGDRFARPEDTRNLGNDSEDISTRHDSPPTSPGASRFLPDVVIGTADEDVSSEVHVQLRGASGFGLRQRGTRPEYINLSDMDQLGKQSQLNSLFTGETIPVTGYYDEPPEPKPVLPPKKYKLMEPPKNSTAILLKKDGTLPRNADGYIPMQELGAQQLSSRNSEEYFEDTEKDYKISDKQAQIDDPEKLGNHPGSSSRENDDPSYAFDSLSDRSTASSSKTVCLLDPTEMELLEVLVGVKEKAISMTEVEDFFTSWKDRPDVKHHYKEKQKDLEELRAEYSRIQAEQGGNLNLPLFDRVIKLFGMTRRKKTGTFSEAIDTSSARASEPNNDDDNDALTPPPLFQRNDKKSVDNSPSPSPLSSEKVWGNAMCRKCVAVSYIEPSSFNDTTNQNSEGYIKLEDDDSNQIQPDVTTEPDDSNMPNENASSEHSPKEISNDLETKNIFGAQYENCLDSVSQIPPPIPPKKKDLKLPFDVNRPVPVRPPRNAKDSSHHFVNYNDRKASKGSTSTSPDYTNSPKSEASSTLPESTANKGSDASSSGGNSAGHFFNDC